MHQLYVRYVGQEKLLKIPLSLRLCSRVLRFPYPCCKLNFCTLQNAKAISNNYFTHVSIQEKMFYSTLIML